jgi:hypothetical protein
MISSTTSNASRKIGKILVLAITARDSPRKL